MQILSDPVKVEGKLKASETWQLESFEAEEALQESLRAAEAAERAAKQAAATASNSVKKSEELC